MGTGGRAWCRGLLGVLLVAAGAAVEQYDELPGMDDVAYQDDNDIDTGPRIADKRLSPTSPKDVMLYRILRALQLQESAYYNTAVSPNDVRAGVDERHTSEGLYPKNAMFKRRTDTYSSMNLEYKGPEPALRPHRKWKIKKGKAIGSQMVCYFKLCAFRSPA